MRPTKPRSRAIGNAQNELLDMEELEEADLSRIRKEYEALARKARAERRDASKE